MQTRLASLPTSRILKTSHGVTSLRDLDFQAKENSSRLLNLLRERESSADEDGEKGLRRVGIRGLSSAASEVER